jgi:type I restriction enzyme, S subunit
LNATKVRSIPVCVPTLDEQRRIAAFLDHWIAATDGVKHIPPAVNARFAHHALREGDVVTVRVGAPGVTCVVPKEAEGLNCGSLMIIRRAPTFDSRWLAHVMNSSVVRAQIELVQYGAAQEQINITDAVIS